MQANELAELAAAAEKAAKQARAAADRAVKLAIPITSETKPVKMISKRPKPKAKSPEPVLESEASGATGATSTLTSEETGSSLPLLPSEPSDFILMSEGSEPVTLPSELKPKSKSKAAASGALSLSLSLSLSTLKSGFQLYVSNNSLSVARYDSSMLEQEHNRQAKLLVVDIESCKDNIYPVAIDLAPKSTNGDILNYIVKVLNDANSKNLRCHTGMHVYTIVSYEDTPRVLYISI